MNENEILGTKIDGEEEEKGKEEIAFKKKKSISGATEASK